MTVPYIFHNLLFLSFQTFSMRCTTLNGSIYTTAYLSIDGTRIGGVTMPPRPLECPASTSCGEYKSVPVSETERKPFVFSNVQTTGEWQCIEWHSVLLNIPAPCRG